MKILIANDHRGIKLKKELIEYLTKKNYSVENLGTNKEESVDYPVLAFKLSKKIKDNKNLGILICGTGIGMSIAANKVKGIRCAKVCNSKEAKFSRLHNNANVIAISAGLPLFKVKRIVKNFIETSYSNEERHQRRIDMISKYEDEQNA